MTEDKNDRWTNEKWTEKVILLEEWMKENKDDPEMEFIIEATEMHIRRGNKQPDKREKSWQSILLEFRNVPNKPVGGIGATSNLPKAVQEAIATIKQGLIDERTPAYGKFSSLVQFRRKSEGEGKNKTTTFIRFKDANDNAEAWANGRIAMLKKLYNEKIWDGSIEGLATIAQDEVKTDDS